MNQLQCMNYSFIFAFIFASVQLSLAQNRPLFENEIELDSTTRISYLTKIFPLDSYCVFAEGEQEDPLKSFVEIHGDNFLFFEIDEADTLIAFDGKLCGGYETGLVNLYKFENGQPKSILTRQGEIAHIMGDVVWIYTYPCCAQRANIVKPFFLSSGESAGCAHLFYDRHDESAVLNSIDSNHREMELIRDSEIRWSPFLNDGPITPFCLNIDNVVRDFHKGQEGKVVNVGLHGWSLVRFDSMLINDTVCIDEYSKQLIGVEKYTVYGWMKLDNLRFK